MAGLAIPSDGDLRALMAVIDDGLRDEPGEAMPWAVLDGLLRLVTCDVAVFNDINLAEQQAITVQAVEAGGLHLLEVGENLGRSTHSIGRTGSASCPPTTRTAAVTWSVCSVGQTSAPHRS